MTAARSIPGDRPAITPRPFWSAGIASLPDHIGVLFRLVVMTIGLIRAADDSDAIGSVAEPGEAVDIGRRRDDRKVARLKDAIVGDPKLGRARDRLIVDALVNDVANSAPVDREGFPDAVVVRGYRLAVGDLEDD